MLYSNVFIEQCMKLFDDKKDQLDETQTKIKDLFNEINDNETYSTYCIYSVQEDDTFEKITSKYNIKKEEILLYNDVVDLNPGIKLVIPDVNKNE